MSFTITTDVFCDKCMDWTPGTASHRIDKRSALEIAKSRGWTKKSGKHLCPLCNGKARLKLASGDYIFNDEAKRIFKKES